MNCDTFNYIFGLKKKFGEKWHDFDLVVTSELKSIISECQSYDYNVLLEKMFGIFPEELDKCCRDNKIKLVIPRNRSRLKNPDYEKDSELLKLLPPPHLANYEWRYTKKSADALLYLLIPARQNKNICCLGTPTLALEILQLYDSVQPTLLDINSPLINEIRNSLFSSKIKSQVYDVRNELPGQFKNKFDLVFINPPWYLDYYKVFINRAMELLVKTGGEIVLPLFSPLARHTSLRDLESLYAFLEVNGLNNISSLGKVSFVMPGFEKNVLQMKKVPEPPFDWRKAEMIKIVSNSNNFATISEIQIEEKEWIRHYNSKKKSYRVVDIERLSDKSVIVQNKECQQLDTLSRKEISLRHFDIWDENNQVITFR